MWQVRVNPVGPNLFYFFNSETVICHQNNPLAPTEFHVLLEVHLSLNRQSVQLEPEA